MRGKQKTKARQNIKKFKGEEMNLKKFAATLVASSFILGGNAMAGTNVVKSPLEAVSMVSEWDKVFAKSDKVDHK